MTWLPDEETLGAWATAASDAGFDPDIAHLFVARSSNDEKYQAMHYPPGMWALPHDRTFDFSGGLRERIYELEDEQVVVLVEGKPPELRLLLLRHEAEHVGQDLFLPAIGQVGVRLYDLFGDAYYSATPHERDADAAATAMRKALDLASSADVRAANPKLHDAEWIAPDRQSLPLRLLAFSLFNPKDFDTACRSSSSLPSVDPDALLEDLLPGATKVRAAVGEQYKQRALDAVAYEFDETEWRKRPQEERDAVLDELRGRLVQEEQKVIDEIQPLLG
jgi:hypothetical protein